MSLPATARYKLRPAPGGLALVQDFINTRAIRRYGADLLAQLDTARAWSDEAVAQWAATRGIDVPSLELSDTSLSALREVRASFVALVGGEPDAGRSILWLGPVAASIILTPGGGLRLEPAGRDWRWLVSALAGEALLAQHAGTWKRLKLCHNPGCRSAFYDNSKNNSGVWHDVRTCGNAANLRASRARRRARPGVTSPGG